MKLYNIGNYVFVIKNIRHINRYTETLRLSDSDYVLVIDSHKFKYSSESDRDAEYTKLIEELAKA